MRCVQLAPHRAGHSPPRPSCSKHQSRSSAIVAQGGFRIVSSEIETAPHSPQGLQQRPPTRLIISGNGPSPSHAHSPPSHAHSPLPHKAAMLSSKGVAATTEGASVAQIQCRHSRSCDRRKSRGIPAKLQPDYRVTLDFGDPQLSPSGHLHDEDPDSPASYCPREGRHHWRSPSPPPQVTCRRPSGPSRKSIKGSSRPRSLSEHQRVVGQTDRGHCTQASPLEASFEAAHNADHLVEVSTRAAGVDHAERHVWTMSQLRKAKGLKHSLASSLAPKDEVRGGKHASANKLAQQISAMPSQLCPGEQPNSIGGKPVFSTPSRTAGPLKPESAKSPRPEHPDPLTGSQHERSEGSSVHAPSDAAEVASQTSNSNQSAGINSVTEQNVYTAVEELPVLHASDASQDSCQKPEKMLLPVSVHASDASHKACCTQAVGLIQADQVCEHQPGAHRANRLDVPVTHPPDKRSPHTAQKVPVMLVERRANQAPQKRQVMEAEGTPQAPAPPSGQLHPCGPTFVQQPGEPRAGKVIAAVPAILPSRSVLAQDYKLPPEASSWSVPSRLIKVLPAEPGRSALLGHHKKLPEDPGPPALPLKGKHLMEDGGTQAFSKKPMPLPKDSSHSAGTLCCTSHAIASKAAASTVFKNLPQEASSATKLSPSWMPRLRLSTHDSIQSPDQSISHTLNSPNTTHISPDPRSTRPQLPDSLFPSGPDLSQASPTQAGLHTSCNTSNASILGPQSAPPFPIRQLFPQLACPEAPPRPRSAPVHPIGTSDTASSNLWPFRILATPLMSDAKKGRHPLSFCSGHTTHTGSPPLPPQSSDSLPAASTLRQAEGTAGASNNRHWLACGNPALLPTLSTTLADAWEKVLQSRSGMNSMLESTSQRSGVWRDAGGSYSGSFPSRSMLAASQGSQMLQSLHHKLSSQASSKDISCDIRNLHWPRTSATNAQPAEAHQLTLSPPGAAALVPSCTRGHSELLPDRTQAERMQLERELESMHKHKDLFCGRFRILGRRKQFHGRHTLVQVRCGGVETCS
jgi:hypothetical protein